LLVNIALNGMQQILPAGLGYVRYADDGAPRMLSIISRKAMLC
jgi:hypothetical protein